MVGPLAALAVIAGSVSLPIRIPGVRLATTQAFLDYTANVSLPFLEKLVPELPISNVSPPAFFCVLVHPATLADCHLLHFDDR